MVKEFSHQLTTGISFGLTSGVITALGMIVGLNSATSSRVAVTAGIIVMAIADGLADAAGLHLSEEAETENEKAKHSQKEIWMTTLFAFLSVTGFILTFAVPLLILPLNTAVWVAVAWGMFLIVILNYYIARTRGESELKLIFEHVFLALFVIVISYWAGDLVGRWIK